MVFTPLLAMAPWQQNIVILTCTVLTAYRQLTYTTPVNYSYTISN